jgi:hypothetical protein
MPNHVLRQCKAIAALPTQTYRDRARMTHERKRDQQLNACEEAGRPPSSRWRGCPARSNQRCLLAIASCYAAIVVAALIPTIGCGKQSDEVRCRRNLSIDRLDRKSASTECNAATVPVDELQGGQVRQRGYVSHLCVAQIEGLQGGQAGQRGYVSHLCAARCNPGPVLSEKARTMLHRRPLRYLRAKAEILPADHRTEARSLRLRRQDLRQRLHASAGGGFAVARGEV